MPSAQVKSMTKTPKLGEFVKIVRKSRNESFSKLPQSRDSQLQIKVTQNKHDNVQGDFVYAKINRIL